MLERAWFIFWYPVNNGILDSIVWTSDGWPDFWTKKKKKNRRVSWVWILRVCFSIGTGKWATRSGLWDWILKWALARNDFGVMSYYSCLVGIIQCKPMVNLKDCIIWVGNYNDPWMMHVPGLKHALWCWYPCFLSQICIFLGVDLMVGTGVPSSHEQWKV